MLLLPDYVYCSVIRDDNFTYYADHIFSPLFSLKNLEGLLIPYVVMNSIEECARRRRYL